MITMYDFLTASGSYPDRAQHPELTDELKANATKLLEVINRLLKDLGITKARVSSGFRPSAVNAATPGAAKKSNHTKCLAIDIVDDKEQSLGHLMTIQVLAKYDLYMEHLDHTKGKSTNWVHCQIAKTKSGNRIFLP